MTITIDPSIEACQALIARINSGNYGIAFSDAEYMEEIIDPLENVTSHVMVTVVPVTEEQRVETLAVTDVTSHEIRIYVRSKLTNIEPRAIDDLKLFTRQVFDRCNNYDTTDKRVRVWECDQDAKQKPDKDALRDRGVFLASIILRVEVGAS
jgi:hypothetical protein